jgi:cobalamin biosynthesis protein CobT
MGCTDMPRAISLGVYAQGAKANATDVSAQGNDEEETDEEEEAEEEDEEDDEEDEEDSDEDSDGAGGESKTPGDRWKNRRYTLRDALCNEPMRVFAQCAAVIARMHTV